jgi:hypothetical protein
LDLFDVARSCVRRWYVLLPLLLITVFYSHHLYASVKPVYYGNAVVGLSAPSARVELPTQGQSLPRNGLMDVGGASLIANMSALALRQPSAVDRVVAAGGLSNYSAKLFPVPVTQPPIPLVMIEETWNDPASVTKTLDLVIAEFGVTLRNLQQHAGVPDDQMVTPFVVSPPSEPAAAMPSRTQKTILRFMTGLGVTLLFTVLVDVLLVRRRKRIEAGPQAPSDSRRLASPDHTRSDVADPDGVIGVN